MTSAGFSLDPLIERAGDPAFVIDPLEDQFVAANAAGCELLGYPREELLRTPVSRIHPGELEQLQAFVGTVLGHGHGSTITLTCRVRQGARLPIELSLSAFRNGGRVYLLGLVNDRARNRYHLGCSDHCRLP